MWFSTFFGEMPLPKNLSSTKLARLQNDREFFTTFASLLNLVCGIYVWEGLPDTCDPRSLEAALIFRGCACIVPYGGGVTNMGAAPGGGYNVHGEFTRFFAYGWNGFSHEYDNYIRGAEISPALATGADLDLQTREKGVFIRDNYFLMPYVEPLISYSKRLTDTMRRLDTTSYGLTWPAMFTVDDQQVNTVKLLLQKHDDNVPIVIGRKTLDQIGMQKVDFGISSDSLDTLWRNYDRLYGRLMEIFGIESNPTIGKAERVNTLETASNSVRTALTRENRLHCRERACEDINRLFGLNVSVRYDETVTERAYTEASQLYEMAKQQPGSGEGGNNDV